MYFLGEFQLACFGVIGEYVDYGEVKSRPRHFIDRMIGPTVQQKPIRHVNPKFEDGREFRI